MNAHRCMACDYNQNIKYSIMGTQPYSYDMTCGYRWNSDFNYYIYLHSVFHNTWLILSDMIQTEKYKMKYKRYYH